jgi:transposase
MLIVETIRKIRQAYHRDKKSIREIARDFNMSRTTIRKVIRSDTTEFKYIRQEQPRPKLGPFEERLLGLLTEDAAKPPRQRRSALLLFEELQREGFTGGYDSIRRYVQKWRVQEKEGEVKAFIPLSFDPGEAFQFDWSYEQVVLAGVNVTVKVAQFRLCHSRMQFCRAYMRETLEMVLDAHVQAFEFFGGACRRGIYDNLKTVVTKVLMGKDRVFNRRFQTLASHYLFEPVACTPAAGWEKGQVENQVGFVRNRFFAKRRNFADLDELNQWLSDECRILAISHKHPEWPERTVGEVFQEERSRLVTVTFPFDGYLESQAKASPTSLILFDRNRYSVNACAARRAVMVRAYADRVVVVWNGLTVAVHRRQFGRDRTIYDPWHYLEILKIKPGALRNGAPFKGWELPQPLKETRAALIVRPDGDRQFVGILAAVPTYGMEAVVNACAEAIAAGTASRDVVLNILSRRNEQETQDCEPSSNVPVLTMPPVADCKRYDRLLGGGFHAA